MKIARPARPEAPFKRKRRPPPQATKLLRYSLLAGIVFMVLLAIVFLPRMFVSQPPVATPVVMELNTTMANRIDVISVGALVSLTKFEARLSPDNVTLGPPLGGSNAALSFTDANDDGMLGPGDYFGVSAGQSGCQSLDVFQLESERTFHVGRWGECPPT